MKKGNILQLLEMHVDKIVLGVMIVISLVILWMYVVGSPYGQEVDGRKRGPGEIDAHVRTKADTLRQALDQNGDATVYDKTYLAEYDKLVQCPISTIASLPIPCPGPGATLVVEDRLYALPEIAPLTDVAASNLRGAAQKPLEQAAGMEMMDMTAMSQTLEDVDLVTVSARFNMQSLFNGFQQSFFGPRLKPGWKDANLAKPVFARLELQRRELLEGGTYSEWSSVPRTQIDPYKKLIEELPLTTDQLQFGVGVGIWMSQYTDKLIQRDILQPQAYSFVVTRSEWMPPTYLQEAFDLIKKQDELRERQLREERAKRLEETTNMNEQIGGGRRPEAARPTPTRPERRQPEGRRGRENPMMIEMGMPETAAPTRPVRKERTLDDVKADAKKALFDDRTDLAATREPVLIWAHDDTAQPGKTYQYRLRLGVFNPIAGKNWFREDQTKYKDQVVLWSEFTGPTSDIYVPKRVHVFPTELLTAKNSPNAMEGVKVEVAKYNIGRWHTQTFDVFPGQIIGQKAEVKAEEIQGITGFGMENAMMPQAVNPLTTAEPQIIDFTTSFTLVDINHLVTWGGNAQRRSGYDVILYHDPQLRLRQAAIGRNNWDADLKKEYDQVKDELQKAIQQFSPGMMPGMPGGPMQPMYEGQQYMPPA